MAPFFATHESLESAVQQAEDCWRNGRWTDAMHVYCDVFVQRSSDLESRGARLAPADLMVLERITDFAVPLGCRQEAEAILRHVETVYRAIGDDYWADRISIKRVHLALNDHQAGLAFERFAELCGSRDFSIRSIERWVAGYHAANGREELFAQVWLELGRLHHLQGQHRPALLCLERGLGYASASDAARVALRLWAVRCLLELGELGEAAAQLSAAQPLLDTARHPGQSTAWHEIAGKLQLLRGDLGAAQAAYREVWKICEAFGFAGPMLRSAANVAQMLILVNHTIEAQRILAQILAIAGAHGETRVAIQARRLLDVARARFGASGHRAAAVKDEQMAAVRVDAPDPELFPAPQAECYTLSHFEDRALQFQFHLRRRDLGAARAALDRLQPFRETDSAIVHARLDAMRAILEYYAGDADAARPRLMAARQRLSALGLKAEHWQVQVLLSRCMNDRDERTRLREDNDRLLEEIGGTLPLGERVSFFLDKATQLDEAIAARVHRLQQLEEALRTAGVFRRWRLRLAIWQEISRLFDAAYWQREQHNARLLDRPEDPARRRSQTSTWRRWLWTSPAEATVAFLVLPDSTVVLCQRWLSLSFRVCSIDRHTLRRLVGRWHRLIPEADVETRDATLRALASALECDAVVASLPFHVRRLRVLPDDALHGAPFAAFEIASGGPEAVYWADRFAVSIGFQPDRRPRRAAARQVPLVAGVSTGSATTAPLLKTTTQLACVTRWLESRGQRPVSLLNAEATADAVCAQLQAATFFHVSCHGDFVQGDPARTGLRLNSANGEETLSLRRVSGLDLSRLEHVTLVACWAADNFILPGRWILSLPEALWRAGTGSVLASLWEVEEDVAERFVEAFYRHLAGNRPDVALRRAQREMRAAGGALREVRNWAGFQVYGDPNPLSM